ncbi:MAG: helix-turn-helix transcriptional regulator [Candidatus Galacturonibacter soehngenii]|nr:helix-turn-helix transcriptional regulator [Candidatus Galacturonibacter soehngenii]
MQIDLKRYRYDAEITQQEVADTLGVSRQCVARYEKQKKVPDRHIIKICKLFNINPEEVEY